MLTSLHMCSSEVRDEVEEAGVEQISSRLTYDTQDKLFDPVYELTWGQLYWPVRRQLRENTRKAG